MVIYQADIYDIPITIKLEDGMASPDNVDDIIIAIGEMVRSYKKGTLKFDEGQWLFPLSEETRKMSGVFEGQAEIVISNAKLHTAVFYVKFAPSVKSFID